VQSRHSRLSAAHSNAPARTHDTAKHRGCPSSIQHAETCRQPATITHTYACTPSHVYNCMMEAAPLLLCTQPSGSKPTTDIMDGAEHSCSRTGTDMHQHPMLLLYMQQTQQLGGSHLLAITDTYHRHTCWQMAGHDTAHHTNVNKTSKLSLGFSSGLLTAQPGESHPPTRLSR
jgi:hypothetical protein